MAEHSLGQFVREAAKDFKHVGTLFPTASWVAKKIAHFLPSRGVRLLEYGAGDGSITKELLEHTDRESRIEAVEIHQPFVRSLKDIRDSRLQVHGEDVLKYVDKLLMERSGDYDAVISGVPFSFFPRDQREDLVRKTYELIKPGGLFVVYQVTPVMRPVLKKIFGNCRVEFEAFNFPPYFVMVSFRGYSCR